MLSILLGQTHPPAPASHCKMDQKKQVHFKAPSCTVETWQYSTFNMKFLNDFSLLKAVSLPHYKCMLKVKDKCNINRQHSSL